MGGEGKEKRLKIFGKGEEEDRRSGCLSSNIQHFLPLLFF